MDKRKERINILVALVTEFPQDEYFQWRWVWDMKRQIRTQHIVKTITMDSNHVANCPLDHPYWYWLKKADMILVYCSRSGQNDVVRQNDFGVMGKWIWWMIPFYAKKLMRPDAKMLVQFDDDFIWVFHQDWNWFDDKPDNKGGPENFFKETGILEVGDVYLTVLEHPPWEHMTSKPIRYLPLPQTWRYEGLISEAELLLMKAKTIRKIHGNTIALLRHSSVIGSIDHTMKNVLNKIGIPVTYFSTNWTDPHIPKYKVPVETMLYLGREAYLRTLREKCFLAIDDSENYLGWSRFAMECAFVFIPCIGSNHAVKLFFPELYTEHKDYARQTELVNQLVNNPEFYERIACEGHKRCIEHLSPDRLCGELIRLAKEAGSIEAEINFKTEQFLMILDKLLPWYVCPPRPLSPNDCVFDNLVHHSITQAEWDAFYGPFESFIKDEKVYQVLIREALDRKDGKDVKVG